MRHHSLKINSKMTEKGGLKSDLFFLALIVLKIYLYLKVSSKSVCVWTKGDDDTRLMYYVMVCIAFKWTDRDLSIHYDSFT